VILWLYRKTADISRSGVAECRVAGPVVLPLWVDFGHWLIQQLVLPYKPWCPVHLPRSIWVIVTKFHTILFNFSPPLHYSKTSTGYPLNGKYISNWPPWRIRHCTLASHLICPNWYNIMNPQGLCDLPLLLNSLLYDTTLNLARVHFESQHHKYGIYCLPIPTFRRHLKTHYFQPMLIHFQRALILYRRRRCINHLLTYFSKKSTYLWFIYSRRCGVVCPTELGALTFLKGMVFQGQNRPNGFKFEVALKSSYWWRHAN